MPLRVTLRVDRQLGMNAGQWLERVDSAVKTAFAPRLSKLTKIGTDIEKSSGVKFCHLLY